MTKFLSPLDSRYRAETEALADYLSEPALNRARLHVEVEWLIFLSVNKILPGAPVIGESEIAYLRALVEDFDDVAIARLAEFEAETRHDVKAVEYYLKEKMHAGPAPLPQMDEIVHIFATSEDINNLAHALNIKHAVESVWLPQARAFVAELGERARDYAEVPMLARTHGQAASPTTLGKEFAVFAWRLTRQLERIDDAVYLGKFNGATGTYGAHAVSVPDADWPALAKQFVEGLGLTFNPLTTQIESHDWMAELFADVARFGRIAHNLATDFWTYISLGYLKQNLAAQGSTGSSTMPHKVNPIRFENAEANLEMSCALFDTLSATLVTSRLQRDLTDSSTLRNVGVAFGHSLLAVKNLRRGLAGVDANPQRLDEDLDRAWEVLAEPIQQVMRTARIAGVEGMEDPYERLKELTRGHAVDEHTMRDFIASLGLPADLAERLANLSPATYTGVAAQLAKS
ncbi:adenylosuccinate lyase [Trueperella bialowiezensis]|uniref:Adenylosuccinate lyase n=1 Tax=Trueperella bialowiezensis TaxID=312285 RepID=A0A448PEU9_9ACTO|nr:adenylosuccinate lyase [Trueperella bialowiezensis]VEI13463.1 Adenylosuccinate lyase [Trueperella bialowiezensis]